MQRKKPKKPKKLKKRKKHPNKTQITLPLGGCFFATTTTYSAIEKTPG